MLYSFSKPRHNINYDKRFYFYKVQPFRFEINGSKLYVVAIVSQTDKNKSMS